MQKSYLISLITGPKNKSAQPQGITGCKNLSWPAPPKAQPRKIVKFLHQNYVKFFHICEFFFILNKLWGHKLCKLWGHVIMGVIIGNYGDTIQNYEIMGTRYKIIGMFLAPVDPFFLFSYRLHDKANLCIGHAW